MTLLTDDRIKLTHSETIKLTHEGMAHFSDPSIGWLCGSCRFFGLSGRTFTDMSEQPCSKFVELSHWKLKKCPPRIPKTTAACKYFESKD